jgi:hypothetical protein
MSWYAKLFGPPARNVEQETSASVYQYQPLKDGETRLLHIDPARYTCDPISCRLQVTALTYPAISEGLKKVEPYCTLSYAWPRPDPDGRHALEEIRIDDRTLTITTELARALRAIRSHLDAGRLAQPEEWHEKREGKVPAISRPGLWVDAICISQSDELERAQQVQMMADIYEASLRLLVWLGGFSAGCLGEEEAQYLKNLSATQSATPHTFDAARSAILDRSWFRRRWIVQEFRLTEQKRRYFLIADSMVEAWYLWYDITQSDRRLQSIKGHEVKGFGPLRDFRSSMSDLLDELHRNDAAACSDPRDRIYALMHLAPLKGRVLSGRKAFNDIHVDYARPVEDVYVDFAQLCLRSPNRSSSESDGLALFKLLASATAHPPANCSIIPVSALSRALAASRKWAKVAYAKARCPFSELLNTITTRKVSHGRSSPVLSPRFSDYAQRKMDYGSVTWPSWIPDWRTNVTYHSGEHQCALELLFQTGKELDQIWDRAWDRIELWAEPRCQGLGLIVKGTLHPIPPGGLPQLIAVYGHAKVLALDRRRDSAFGPIVFLVEDADREVLEADEEPVPCLRLLSCVVHGEFGSGALFERRAADDGIARAIKAATRLAIDVEDAAPVDLCLV